MIKSAIKVLKRRWKNLNFFYKSAYITTISLLLYPIIVFLPQNNFVKVLGGIIGMIFLLAFFSTIVSFIYFKIKKFFAKIQIKKNTKKKKNFDIIEIPRGYEVYDSLFVQGTSFRKDDCIKWATGENHSIRFKREPNNNHDSNAIAIYGESTNGIFHLGYVASDIAEELVDYELDDKIIARLISVKITTNPFIEYEILIESKDYANVKEDIVE